MKQKIFFLLLCSSLLYADLVSISFKGNKHFSERELYSSINLYKPYLYEFWKQEPQVNPQTATLLVQTIKNYYRSRGFFHTEVLHNNKEKLLEIIIEEKDSIQVADIAVISKLDISSKIPFQNGEIFDPKYFEQSKKSIYNNYLEQGYCNASLNAKTWVDLDTNSAYLVYDVTQNDLCYFGDITISPPENIDPNIIKSLLYIKKGELFSPDLISRTYKSLYGYEGISKAIIDTQIENNNTSKINIKVTQNEKPLRFQAGAGLSSDEGVMVALGVKHSNFFGNLKTLSLNTRFTQIKRTIKSNFDMPLKNRNFFGAEIGYEDEKFLGYEEDRILGMLFLKQRKINYSFQESLLFDHSTTFNSDDLVLFPEGELFVISPKLQWTFDIRDNLLNPTKGYLFALEVMGSVLSEISDATYYKYKLSGAYIIPLLPSVVALKMNFGSVHIYDGDIPASYRFYAGGMNSNRAYAYRKLGPTNSDNDPTGLDSILEMTAEYRFPIYGDFRGVIFNDNTFTGDSAYANQKGYYSAGTGLRYVTPIGPIAIDVGFDIKDPLNQYAIHFHIGELF